MPPWFIILVLMEMAIVLINPTRKDFVWYQSLRRPSWMTFHVWVPLIWLGIYITFYGSSLFTWYERRSWPLVGTYILLLVLLEGYSWIVCRTRRLGTGTILALICWLFTLILALILMSQSPAAALLLLPLLIWLPFEATSLWQMRRLNRKASLPLGEQ
ncbi:MAG: tryptophan-rich sensory protein [Synechococcaceae cyanobacterium]|nr:tryptophan-rich sensory protein [Synechococcaceae cyanobacterium]